MNNKEFPEVDLFVNSNGVTIFCPYLSTPRFIPFDMKGRCSTCKSDNVEIDYVLQSEGITIYCSRMKHERFIGFDVPTKFHDRSSIRIRARGKVYNVPLTRLEMINTEDKKILDEFIITPPPPPPPSIVVTPPTPPPSVEVMMDEVTPQTDVVVVETSAEVQ